jgi:hypothetical protein
MFKNPKKAANTSSKMASPATLFGVEEDAADSRSVIESVWSGAFFKRIAQKRNRDFLLERGSTK